MKTSMLGIITVATVALASPAFAYGHGGGDHGSGGHFSHSSGFGGARSFQSHATTRVDQRLVSALQNG